MSAVSSRARPASLVRGTARALRTIIAFAVVSAGLLVGSGSALAAVAQTHVIAALPDSSGLELTYPDVADGTQLTVAVLRQGFPVASGHATIDAGAGAINGGGAISDCWTGVTPDILAGDTVEVTGTAADGTGFDDTMTVQTTTADSAIQTGPASVVVHGTAADPSGGPVPIATVSARLIASGRFDRGTSGGRQLRAGTGNAFPLSYDAPGSTHWTATFAGLSSHDVALALGAEARGVFTSSDLTELTISQNPAARGPVAPCTAPLAQNAATSTDHTPAINLANRAQDLAIHGVAQSDVTDVSVALRDSHGTTLTENGTLTPGTNGQTWTVTVPAGDVDGLLDGTLTATPTFSSASLGTFDGSALSILKDTVAPAAPFATPAPGTYVGARSVTLSDVDTSAVIHWAIAPAVPTASSSTVEPINVSSSRTINAIAIDPAGNTSGAPVAFAYVITSPPAPPAPQPPSGGQGGPGTVTTIIQQVPVAGAVSATGTTAVLDLVPPRLTLSLPARGVRLVGSAVTFALTSDEIGSVTVGATVGQRGSSQLIRLRGAARTLTA